jgi:phage-related protein
MAITLDTDTTYKLTKNISKTESYNVKETEFGDGYRQIIIDGINYQKEIWNLDFIPLDTTASITLEGILLNSINGTSNYISWTPPGETTTKYWTAQGINKTSTIKPYYWKITCQLRREFPLI